MTLTTTTKSEYPDYQHYTAPPYTATPATSSASGVSASTTTTDISCCTFSSISASMAAAPATPSPWHACSCCLPNNNNSKRSSTLTSLGIGAIILVYTMLGAFVFMSLESPSNADSAPGHHPRGKPKNEAQLIGDELRLRTVEKLWVITEEFNILYKDNWTRLATLEVQRFQDQLVQRVREKSAVGNLKDVDGVAAAATMADLWLPGTQTQEVFQDAGVKVLPVTQFHALEQDADRWTFASSFLYALTLITTIGYGASSPRSTWGRLLSMVYALAGIPLMLVYLSTIGDSFAESFQKAYACLCLPSRSSKHATSSQSKDKKIKKKKMKTISMSAKSPLTSNHVEVVVRRSERCPGAEGTHLDGTAACSDTRRNQKGGVRVPVLVCILVVVTYIGAGGLLFHHMEGWTILEGSYFSFAILGTIGFGDLVPGRSARLKPYMTPKWRSEIPCVAAASLYILFGMALVAMSFSLVQDDFVKVLRSLSRTCSRHSSTESSTELEPS